jgi:pyruvate,orthophosphate dikinase
VTGRGFGDPVNPLLVSVRSGARVSMPGMMDTVLDLGLNDATVLGLAQASGDARFAWDSYRRFIQIYGDVALGVDHHPSRMLWRSPRKTMVSTPMSRWAQHWQALVTEYKASSSRKPARLSRRMWVSSCGAPSSPSLTAGTASARRSIAA